ncbi:MAG: 1-deoxy-D-xylulose-5-phosphate reductoisomerase [Thermodesulfobacteriota bacterium]
MKKLSLLGSTGSIGTNVLDVVRKFPGDYSVVALAAGKNIERLQQQALEFQPQLISVQNEQYGEQLIELLGSRWKDRVVWGVEGNIAVASHPDAEMTVSAIVGGAGLLPTLSAIEAGKDVGLANKETLVMAGRLVMDAVKKNNIQLLPIDSEHSAIFQALEAGHKDDLAKIILTASGGPFRHRSKEELDKVTPAQALAHPNWEMGRKISIDSATLMNKGLEVIEAKWLFDVKVEDVEVVVHPQSIVHSLVEYHDGSVMAHLGIPDMRIPIAYALSYPRRMPLGLKPLKLWQCGHLEFQSPDYERFPALNLAFEAIGEGGILPAALNGANEVAVDAFLEEKISFPRIAAVVREVVESIPGGSDEILEDILDADREARRIASRLIDSGC